MGVSPAVTADPADLAAIRAQFHPAPGITYLDSATYGLPPQATVDALDRATRLWQAGTGDWVTDWDAPSDGAPRDFARLIGARRGHHRDDPGLVGRDRAGGGDARAG